MKSLRGRVSAKSTPGAGNGRWSTAIRGRWLAVEHPAPAESNGTIQSLDLGRSMLKHSLLGYQLSRRCWPLHLGKFCYISWASRGNVYLSTLIRKEESELPRMMHITTFWVPDRNRGLTLLVREKYKALSIKKDTPQTAAAATLHKYKGAWRATTYKTCPRKRKPTNPASKSTAKLSYLIVWCFNWAPTELAVGFFKKLHKTMKM